MASKVKAKKANGEAARLCKELGCSKLFINTKGEYFTEYTYALSSEGGDKKKVETYEDGIEAEEVETPKTPKAEKTDKEKEPAGKKDTVDEVNEPEKTNGNE
ncbi:hypothetical protein [Bacteroides congonensis]